MAARFRIMQYNVLAKRYARNMEPWFLYDGLRSDGDEDRAKAILARHAARRPDGSYTYAGWPKYAEGILTAKELEAVERRNERDFPFERRAPRLVEVIRAADPDVFSLVECDEYEAFWRGRLEELGYGSVWHKRPRASAPDGCCLGFRERDWALDAHRTISYDDHDRAALMGVLRRRDTGERLVFVSTHLARNPESLKQQGVRLRQVAQLMRELHTFYKEQGIDTAEVPAIVAGDLNAESLQEVTAVAGAVCGLRDLDVHPLLFASNEVPSPVTSQTMRRKSRIDYVVFSDNGLLERLDDDRAPPPLEEEACIPDATHPSDHLPVIGSFRFADKAARSLFCARRVVRDILGAAAPRPLLCDEVALAFEALGGRGAEETARNAYKNGLCAEGDVEKLRDAIDVPRDDEGPHLFLHHAHTAALERSAGVDAAARLAFRFFDRDDDGFVARGELFKTLETILPADVFSEAAVDRIFDAVDRDHDGKISLGEFSVALKHAAVERERRDALSRRDRRGRLGC